MGLNEALRKEEVRLGSDLVDDDSTPGRELGVQFDEYGLSDQGCLVFIWVDILQLGDEDALYAFISNFRFLESLSIR